MSSVDRVADLGGREVHWTLRSAAAGPRQHPPVLFLGGCGVAAPVWDDVADLLPDRDVVRLDRPGLGGSRWPGELPTLAAEVDTLVALVDHLGAAPVLVAHSMAGLHAEALARLHPDRVAGLVLVDASAEWTTAPPGFSDRSVARAGAAGARLARTVLRVDPLLPAVSAAARLMVNLQSRRGLLTPLDRDTRSAYRDRHAAAMVIAELAAYRGQVRALDSLRSRTDWPRLPVTVLTATADGDPDWPGHQRRLADLLAGRLVLVDDSRHLIMIDRPDLVSRAVRTTTPS